MLNRYPFILSSFPLLAIGEKAEISFKETRDLLSMNLLPWDWLKVNQLLWSIDLSNMRSLWLGLPFDERGSLSAKELADALLVKDSLPLFVVDFLDQYDTTEERLLYFPSLYASLYREMIPKNKGFLQSYYRLERETRLVLTALRAKKGGRDLIRELQFEDPSDPFVMEILVQKEAADYIPPKEYEDLKVLFVENSTDPMKLHRALLQYRFDQILDLEEKNQSFAIDRILGFVARLMIVEQWDELDLERGLKLIDDLSKT